jgi:hypothetical protein
MQIPGHSRYYTGRLLKKYTSDHLSKLSRITHPCPVPGSNERTRPSVSNKMIKKRDCQILSVNPVCYQKIIIIAVLNNHPTTPQKYVESEY